MNAQRVIKSLRSTMLFLLGVGLIGLTLVVLIEIGIAIASYFNP